MLNLANLRILLSRVLDLPVLHTVVLFTPEGELVCYASDQNTNKDRIRLVVGLSTEIWQETREQNIGMVDCEVSALLNTPPTTLTDNSSDIYLCLQWRLQRRTWTMSL